LANFRTTPIHADYLARARAHVRRVESNGGATRPAYEIMCPYCGQEGGHRGLVRVGAKHNLSDVPLTTEGMTLPEEVRHREVDLLLIECTLCEAAIDPLAYLAPATFVMHKTQESLWSVDYEEFV
jgi:hypothetical protein